MECADFNNVGRSSNLPGFSGIHNKYINLPCKFHRKIVEIKIEINGSAAKQAIQLLNICINTSRTRKILGFGVLCITGTYLCLSHCYNGKVRETRTTCVWEHHCI
jgi:hypothetical protein